MKNFCDSCGKPTNEAYEMADGGYVCLDCYTSAIERAEMAYEAQREDFV